ncbi:glutamate receptor 1-like [Agrilus planipennis]|uniref:Glutamate receptor 1-like n=1 Tax=Agrilus planipennis TaxID=224129 RepID=A0A7F5RAI4_AGRPL|nr:glutamate receptor 1-like [Agrilus planipennis]
MEEVITIGGVIFDPDTLEHMWDFRNTHLDVLTKSSYIIAHEITRVMNASIAYRMHYAWDYHGNRSEIDPLMQDFISGLTDISGTVIAGDTTRLHIVEYIGSTTPASVAFLLKEPPLSTVYNLYTLTFGTDVWIACGLLILLAFIPLQMIFGWEWVLTHPADTHDNRCQMITRSNLSDTTLFQVEMICQQGTNVVPKSISGRILVLILLIAFMFLYTSFSGNIVALLQSTSDSIQTLDDLLTSRIKLGAENLAYAKHYFSVEEEPLRKKIYNTKLAPKGQQNNFISMKKGIEKVRTEFYAFHCELTSATQIIRKTFREHERCGLKTIPFLSILAHNVIKKNSTFRDFFTVSIRKLGEFGIERRVARKMFASLPVCDKSSGIFVAVGISDCYFVFLLFGVGATISESHVQIAIARVD